MTNEEYERSVVEYVAFILRETQIESGLVIDSNLSAYTYLIFRELCFPDLLPPVNILGFKVLEIPSALFRNEYTFGICFDHEKAHMIGASQWWFGTRLNSKILSMQETFPFHNDSWRKEVGLK